MPTFSSYIHVCSLGVVVALLAIGVSGCTSRTAEEIAEDRAQILGVWKYKTDGIGALQHGTLKITQQNGKLVGQIQDSWRGRIDARIDVQGPYMELDLDRLRITGRLKRGRFTGSVYKPMWDLSRSRIRDESDGYLVARRVRRGQRVDDPESGCRSLLREPSYACPALGFP